MNEVISNLRETFETCDDIMFKPIKIGMYKGFLIYLSDMVDQKKLAEIEKHLFTFYHPQLSQNISALISDRYPFSQSIETADTQSIVTEILAGNTVLYLDQSPIAFAFSSADSTGRKIDVPRTERTVRGPQEGFVENIEKNIMLIRRKIRTPSLKVEHLTLGRQTNTRISVVYIKGVANDEIVKEVHQRLSRINIDGVLDSQYIESMIKDSPKSPFPTVYSTERPDRVCGALLDGKVAILIDGTPFALTVPAMFVEFLHSSEDYYDGSLFATIVRWIRFLGLFVTLILPAFYVAMATFHQDLLQTPFLIRIAASREGLPYPLLLEGIFMWLAYELIREPGLRMPKLFGGPVVTILGLVLIGQATVQAGLVGPVMAIVISVTALTSFILPNYAFHQVIRFCGIPLLLLAGMFGFMGILVGLMFVLAHLVSIRSFGVPYFSPVSPARKESWKDVFIRAPWWAMETRTAGIGAGNFHRSDDQNNAKPPKDSKENHNDE
ncbi:spore germination protein [Bacillus litorisediminis]|uniref:spore germination protein n=1 Tax=Bacillus litorisediminis TaxID=2922713 RepID=UPI001FAF4BAA|nr:spore germination protein [Bacillus litorisediminis]